MARDSLQPTYRVFTVIEKPEGQDDFWLPIGAAFAHQDGRGFNLILQAHPIGNKLVLREPAPDQETTPPPDASPRRDRGRSRR